jgi:hypothetical protein
MSQPDLPGVTRDQWLAPVGWGGLSAYCTGYAIHNAYTFYVSLIGRVTAVKAIWAAFMDGQVLELPLDCPPPAPHHTYPAGPSWLRHAGQGRNRQVKAGQSGSAPFCRLPTDDETKYHTFSVRLPDTDWGHTVIVHSQATQGNLPDRLFYVLSGSPEPPLDQFWAQWNCCLGYPSQPEWAAYLCSKGVGHQLIAPCQSQGTYAWAVSPGETWADIIADGIRDGQIGP